jgi:anti-sigma-K factor RskA
MKSGNRELVDRLAAEYVLGTLRGRARQRFERWLVSPQVGEIVRAWEDRLAGLEPHLGKATPPAAVWHELEHRLDLHRGPVARWVSRHRVPMAAALLLLLFPIIGFYTLRQPPAPVTLAASHRALIQGDPQTIYWSVELLGEDQELAVEVQAVHALDAGQALELWVLPAPGVNHGQPVSLGLLPASGVARRALTPAQRAALAGARQLAVSLEPAGGSPMGMPTGPVLDVAELVAASA